MRLAQRIVFLCSLLIMILPSTARADIQDDLATIGELESAAQEKSLALLSVIKSMGPRLEESDGTREMARIVSISCMARENRMPESRILRKLNINDEFPVVELHESLLMIDLQDGRLGWIDESHVQRFEAPIPDRVYFTRIEPQLLRRYALVTAELMDGIEDDRAMAQEIFDATADQPDSPEKSAINVAYRKIVEYHGYASLFHKRYIVNYDFTLASGRPFMEMLSGWAELLLGTSKFETVTLIAPGDKDKTKESSKVASLGLGGDMDLNDQSSVNASFTRKKEVNQTPYATTILDVGYDRQREDGELIVGGGLFNFADDVNTYNDYSRKSLRAGSLFNRPDRVYDLRYEFSSHAYEETSIDDYLNHTFFASTKIKRDRGRTLNASLQGILESSDVSFHDFRHFTPRVEMVTRSRGGLKSWGGSYEVLSYADAKLRSYRRAQVNWRKTGNQGPRRASTDYSVAHKSYPDNPTTTYLQMKARLSRTLIGEETRRLSGTTYTNFYTDNSDNNFTDLRLSLDRSDDLRNRNVNLYTRLWHKPGDPDGTTPVKPHIIDLFGKYSVTRGHLRLGPTLGMHLMAARGSRIIKQDGNLMRLGAICEGYFKLDNGAHINLDASYDYGFVYTGNIMIDPLTGSTMSDETTTRHPTTFQVNVFGSMPLSPDFDLTGKISLYRIKTDMDQDTSINPVTNNNHFTMFVGVRYRYN